MSKFVVVRLDISERGACGAQDVAVVSVGSTPEQARAQAQADAQDMAEYAEVEQPELQWDEDGSAFAGADLGFLYVIKELA